MSRKPEDWPVLFVKYLNVGDLEAVIALYEPDARFVARSGETLSGVELIRPVLAKLIENNTQLQCEVAKVVTMGDLAVLYTDFWGTRVDPQGSTVGSNFKATEVLRRQPDGAWKLIFGDPNARG